jgi:hypothetical protein
VNVAHRLFLNMMDTPGTYFEAIVDNSTVLQEGVIPYNYVDTGLEEFYPSFQFGDDLFWASTWLYRASKNNIRESNITYYFEAMEVTMNIAYAPRCSACACCCVRCRVCCCAVGHMLYCREPICPQPTRALAADAPNGVGHAASLRLAPMQQGRCGRHVCVVQLWRPGRPWCIVGLRE